MNNRQQQPWTSFQRVPPPSSQLAVILKQTLLPCSPHSMSALISPCCSVLTTNIRSPSSISLATGADKRTSLLCLTNWILTITACDKKKKKKLALEEKKIITHLKIFWHIIIALLVAGISPPLFQHSQIKMYLFLGNSVHRQSFFLSKQKAALDILRFIWGRQGGMQGWQSPLNSTPHVSVTHGYTCTYGFCIPEV